MMSSKVKKKRQLLLSPKCRWENEQLAKPWPWCSDVRLLSQMPTQKECHVCKTKIGVASKTCGHCGAKQPYKQKLEKIKKKLAHGWKERQKKNSSVNKVYDATNLLVGRPFYSRMPALVLVSAPSCCFRSCVMYRSRGAYSALHEYK